MYCLIVLSMLLFQWWHRSPLCLCWGASCVEFLLCLCPPFVEPTPSYSSLNIYARVISMDDPREAAKKSRLVALNMLPIPK